MAKRKRWLRKMSAPAARVQSKVGWESGIEGANSLMEEILAGRIAAASHRSADCHNLMAEYS